MNEFWCSHQNHYRPIEKLSRTINGRKICEDCDRERAEFMRGRKRERGHANA